MKSGRPLAVHGSRYFRNSVISPSRWRLCILVFGMICAVNVGSQVAKAQNYLTAGGAPTFSAPAPIELGFTDTANGNLHLEISSGSLPQRGSKQPLTVKFLHDSNTMWTISCGLSCSWQPSSFTNAWTWRVVVSGGLSAFGGPSNCQAIWTDAAGTNRYFTFTGTDPVTGQNCTGSGWATDSSGYKLLYNIGAVYAPDGTMAGHYGVAQSVPYNTNANAEDANGNYLTGAPQYSNQTTDTLGRALPNWESCTLGTCQFAVPNSQGGTSTYTVTPATINVQTKFGQSGVTEYSGSMTVVQSITLPDGTSYSFKYDCDSSTGNSACGSPSGQTGYYGLLVNTTMPTGATINYTYANFKDSYGNYSRWLTGKWVSGAGSWSYFPQVLSTCSSGQVGCQQQVTVTKPSGAYTITTFTLNNGAWPVKVQAYDSSGNLLSTVTNAFDFSNSCPFQNCHGAAYVRLVTTQTIVPVPGSTGSITKQTQYTYDSPQTGNVTALKEWKYQPGTSPTFSATPDRATYTSYLTTGTNNINRPLSVTVCNNSGSDSACPGGGSRISQTLYVYDSYGSNCPSGGLAPVTGVSHHDDTNFGSSNTQRGNPTSIQRWVSGSTYLTTQLCYDTTGQVTEEIDAKGNVTSYGYSDKFYTENGTNSLQTFTPPSPTNAYVTSVTEPIIGTATVGYYYGSGNMAFLTDENGATAYSHYVDPFDRPTETDYPIGWNKTVYTSETQGDIYVGVGDTTASTSCTSCQHRQIILDALGRKTSEKLVNNPSGAISVDTVYDSSSRVSQISHPYIGLSDPNHVFETYSYDGLDRAIQNTHPDSQALKTFYGPSVTGFGANGLSSQQGSPATYGYGYPIYTVDASGKEKQEWIDGFGRVIEVDEPVTASTPGIGSVTISGSERSKQIHCPLRCITLYDSGTLYITVNGHSDSASYGDGDDSTSVASYLVSAINGDSGAPVSATLNGSTVDLTSKATGSSTNYSLSSSCQNTSGGLFTGCSFNPTSSGSTLTGGSNNGTSLATPTVTLYAFDAADRVTQVIQGVQTRTFAYDGLGRLTSRTTPEAGNDTYSYAVAGVVCSGDPTNVCQRTDARGVTATYFYDTLNRLVGKSYSIPQGSNVAAMPNVCTTSTGASANVCYSYDQGGAGVFALGRRTQMIDPSGSETFAYDRAGRVTQVTKVIGTKTYTIGYQYNAGDEITQIGYPSGRAVQQSYNSVGWLCEIAPSTSACASAASPFATAYSYDAAGHVLGLKYGNGVYGSFGYYANRSQLNCVDYSTTNRNGNCIHDSTSKFGLSYFYQLDSTNCLSGNNLGNDGQAQCINDSVDSGRTANYTFDALGRLSTATTNGSTGFAKWGLSWSYDRYANRLCQTLTAGSGYQGCLSFANPGGAQTNHPDGWCFDASGNLLAKSGACPPSFPNFVYDGENRMVSDSGASFTYDGNGVRVQKCMPNCTSPTSSTVYVYAGSHDVAEYDNGAAPTAPSREFIYSGGVPGAGLLAAISGGSSPTTTYFHSDHLSWRISTDGTTGSSTYGQVNGQQGHYPYGESWYSSNGNEFMFTSYQRDSESGLDYAMARYYDSTAARFCSADPLGGQLGDPQTWNRYAYARNDPVDNVDPSGQDFFSAFVMFFIKLFAYLTGTGPFLNLNTGIATPPIVDNGPLSDTSAIINSINHPQDPSRFVINDWSPAAHDQMIQNALGPCAVSQEYIAKIQKASRDFDESSQDPSMSYAHSMSNGKQVNPNGTVGQSAGEALTKRNQFIVDHITAAQTAWRRGQTNNALADFGEAIHPVMDSTSPWHTDAQGNPIPWCGTAGCKGSWNNLGHSAFDISGETSAYLSKHPEIQAKANSLIRSAFEIMTGMHLNCE